MNIPMGSPVSVSKSLFFLTFGSHVICTLDLFEVSTKVTQSGTGETQTAFLCPKIPSTHLPPAEIGDVQGNVS